MSGKGENEVVTAVAVTSNEMLFSNKVYLSPQGAIPLSARFIMAKEFVLTCAHSEEIPHGKIGLSKKFREFLRVSKIDSIPIRTYTPTPADHSATSLALKVEMLLPPTERRDVDDQALCLQLRRCCGGHYVGMGQIFVLETEGSQFILTVEKVVAGESGRAVLSDTTLLSCQASFEQKIKLKSSRKQQKSIFAANFSMNCLGIGGLDDQLTSLFRRVFASRRLPHTVVQRFGIKHVKGILLFGPPGTGKTLIARQMAQSLRAKSIKVVNGPQIFSKFVGQSEENVRKLFIEAREDQKRFGEESPLHFVVFDEIDAVCRQRGADSGTNARDAVVNQLLTNLDGVEALNNIIVIGMTNRKDLLDEAVLRPGRLEVHIEIGLPNEEGRAQILSIHTKTLAQQRLLDSKVDLKALAHHTKNYTGAELEAVVRNAATTAMVRGNNVMDFSKELKLAKDTVITMEDLTRAADEVKPSFGLDEVTFETLLRNPVMNYGGGFDNALKKLQRIGHVCLHNSLRLCSVLLHGDSGCGKTTLAAYFAKQSSFSFVKLLSGDQTVEGGAAAKAYAVQQVFRKAYRSKDSLIVLDGLQRLVEFVSVGPDYNNTLLQLLLVFVRQPPPPDSRLMIIGTTSDLHALHMLQLSSAFRVHIELPKLSKIECAKVLGTNLGIDAVSIKKLMSFKQACEDKTPEQWKALWKQFN